MAKTSYNPRTLAWLLRAKPSRRGGFTLTELLIAVAVSSIIIATLLYLVVELLQINRREGLLTQTQQDMGRAIDYITRDAGEAVYIYPSPDAVVDVDAGTTLIDQIGDFPADVTPVLAFWRLDPLDPNNANVQTFFNKVCDTAFSASNTEANPTECNTLKIRQGYYTLVIYGQQENADDGKLWGGKSRIVRYELPRYSSSNLPNLIDTQGYSEPTGNDNSFDKWKKGTGTTKGNLAVLTDYLDNPVSGAEPQCPNSNYQASPADADNFYACVLRDTTTTTSGVTSGTNQTLVVFLRGNAATENAGFATFSDAGRLPTLKSEVLIRGVLDKQPSL